MESHALFCGLLINMCFYYDGYNEFQSSRVHKARKQHRCVECNDPIMPGEKYIYFVAKFEGDFSAVKCCRRCEYLRDLIAKKEVERGCDRSESICPFGEIRDYISESSHEENDVKWISKDQVPQEYQLS